MRCSCLHDPRIQSPIPAWLHRSTTASSKLIQNNDEEEQKENFLTSSSTTNTTTSLSTSSTLSSSRNHPFLYQHVDWDCYQKLSHDNYGHPFGTTFLPKGKKSTFDEFYIRIINKEEMISTLITANAAASLSTNTSTGTFAKNNLDHILSESQMLQIVNLLRHSYNKARALHCYRHTHKLYDARVCMLIQTKAFSIASSSSSTNQEVREIPLGKNGDSQPIVIVHEIMFEPTEEESDNIYLLFSDSSYTTSVSSTDHHLTELSVKEAKDVKKLKRKLGKNVLPSSLKIFHLCYPNDKEAHDLVTHMLLHRSKSVSICDKNNFEDMVTGLLSFNCLRKKFHALMNHFALFHWPANQGYKTIDSLTLVPKVDTEYHLPFVTLEGTGFGTFDTFDTPTSRSIVAEVWKSFVHSCTYHDKFPYNATSTDSSMRLRVFTDLSQKSLKNDERYVEIRFLSGIT